ncbi:MAG: T9SS type A sorting domain-containing protein [Bacteroidales bacterium]|nr:T9SS type A sorting domain-containing protein [Bacteroidales bacterium]
MKRIAVFLSFFLFIQIASAQEIPFNLAPDWQSTPLSHVATGLALADINGDGWKDLVVANGNDISIQNLVVYYNSGDGTFPLIPSWSSADSDYHGHCAVGDINKDGWLDVAVSVYIGKAGFSQPGRVKVYYNNGGELESVPSFESVEFYTFSCALGDANGDGWLDLAAATSESYGSIWDKGKIFFNNDGQFNTTADWETASLAGFMDVEFGDMDSNGFLDLVFIGNQYPNAMYLSDDLGLISNAPSWQSAEAVTFNNSIDIGFFGENDVPGFVTTGNNQLGGDGKVRFYDFSAGVPVNSSASWVSPPVGYGSGVILADVTADGDLDLIYGGWWLPMRIIRGTGTSFENTVAYTSSTNSVVEAIQLADLGRESVYTKVETISGRPDQSNAIRLQHQLVENVLEIYKNGELLPSTHYCYVPNKNWISFTQKLIPADVIMVVYEISHDPDIVITNWDSQKGNYIFYNTNIPTGNGQYIEREPSFDIYPNPAHSDFTISLKNAIHGVKNLKVYDIWGKMIFQASFETSTEQLNIKQTGRGFYSVEVECQGESLGFMKLIIH